MSVRPASLIALVVGVLPCAVPLATEAQPGGKVYRIGVPGVGEVASNADNLGAFRQELRELG